MTTDEMISNLSSLLGKVGTVIDAELLVELKLAQIQVERGPLFPWFLGIEKQADTVADEPRIAVPTDFLREADVAALSYVSSEGKFTPLIKKDFDVLRKAYEGETGGVPEYYAIFAGYFWTYPVPDAAYELRMNYYGKQTVLATGDSGNNWSTYYPDLLMGLAGQNAVLHMQSPQNKPRFDEMVMTARKQMTIEETAREVANMERSFGE